MKSKLLLTFIIIGTITHIIESSQGGDPIEPIIYPPRYHNVNRATIQFDPDAPGFNTPENDPKFDNVKPIPFKPEYQTTGTMYGSDKNTIGYFWNTKDNDPSIIYPGKARIGNDQFINVAILDPHAVDQTGLADSFSYTSSENIYDSNYAEIKKSLNLPAQIKNKKDLDFLVRIGTIIIKGKIYNIYGQYESTVVPDPESVETPQYVDVKN